MKALCIVPDRLAWVIYLDIICLNQDGNLLDAALAAGIAALKVTTLPEVIYNVESGEKVVNPLKRQQLNVKKLPLSTTIAVFKRLLKHDVKLFLFLKAKDLNNFYFFPFSDCLLIDPTVEEESFSSGTISIVIEADSGDICGIHQPGTEPLKPSEIDFCITQAQVKTKAVAELIKTAIKNSMK